MFGNVRYQCFQAWEKFVGGGRIEIFGAGILPSSRPHVAPRHDLSECRPRTARALPLGPELEGIETKAVASVPANVANLSQFAPELTVEKLSAALIEACTEKYGRGAVEYWADDELQKYCAATQFLPMLGKNSSNAWNLGHTPKFIFQGLEVVKGRVVSLDDSPLFDEWLASR